MRSSCPEVDGDDLCSSRSMHPEFNSLSDYVESLKLIGFCGISVSGDCKLKVNIARGKRTNLNIHSGNDCHLRKLS